MTYYWDWEHGRRRYLDRLLETIAADPDAPASDYHFDGVIYHLYFTPRQTVDVLNETWQSLARYGMAGKQISINETNAPPSDDPQEPPWAEPRFRVSLVEQAAFILQQFGLAFQAAPAGWRSTSCATLPTIPSPSSLSACCALTTRPGRPSPHFETPPPIWAASQRPGGSSRAP